MAVYTQPESAALARFAEAYALGPVLELAGIRDGIENSNFFLTTPRGCYVLTIFEGMPVVELDWCLELVAWLAAEGTPCALPSRDQSGQIRGELSGKPAAIFARLKGASSLHPTLAQCTAVGDLLGRMHLAGSDFKPRRPDPRGRPWLESTSTRVLPILDPAQARLLREEMGARHDERLACLPAGAIHADLFRDNVLFDGTQLSGTIDFYYACQGSLVYDLAITVIDWCLMARPQLDATAARALIAAYRQHRALTPGEIDTWPIAWRAVTTIVATMVLLKQVL